MAVIAATLAAVLVPLSIVVIAARPAARAVWATPVAGSAQPSTPGGATGSLVPDLPASTALPGTAPRLPWPSTGQASVDVEGVGSLGATPDQHPVPIASIAKVMTAYLVLRDHPMDVTGDGPSLTVTAAEAADYATEVKSNESLVKVAAGEVLTERQALEALLLPSADNIARILARWDAGSVPAFVARMNTTAAALRMADTRYTDPSGYDPATRSTASEQVLLGTQAMRLPAFAQIAAMPRATIPVAGAVQNYNTLLGTDGVAGIKTGSTSSAGGCLLFAAHHQVAGHTVTVIGAVLGQQGATMHGLPQALSASARLVEAATGALAVYTPIHSGEKVATLAGTNLTAATDITILGWPGLAYHVTVKTSTTAVTPDPLPPGTVIGRIDLDTAEQHASTDIVAS